MVIIGSGLGGLACGVILAKNGYQVAVLEQGSQIGGCLQCFNRGKAKFETGMHIIGSASEGQTLDRLLPGWQAFSLCQWKGSLHPSDGRLLPSSASGLRALL